MLFNLDYKIFCAFYIINSINANLILALNAEITLTLFSQQIILINVKRKF